MTLSGIDEHLKHDRIDNLLLSLLQKDDAEIEEVANLTATDWNALIDRARIHSVVSLIWLRLRERVERMKLPPEIVDRFVKLHLQDTGRGIIIQDQIENIVKAAHDAGVPMMLLKGAQLLKLVYNDASLRQMYDIDLLVREESLTGLKEVLFQLGYSEIFVDRYNPKRAYQFPFQPSKNGLRLEVHTSLKSTLLPGELALKEIWERAVTVRFGDAEALAMSPEDLILYICYHSSYHFYLHFGLRSLCDIASVIKRFGVDLDWKRLVYCACKWNITRSSYIGLVLVGQWLKADVPNEVIIGLEPNDANPQLLQMVNSQIFARTGRDSLRSEKIPQLVNAKGVWEKSSVILKGLFPSRVRIVRQYGLKAESGLLYIYYIKHIIDVYRRHRHIFRRLIMGDKTVKDLALLEIERGRQLAEFRQWLISNH